MPPSGVAPADHPPDHGSGQPPEPDSSAKTPPRRSSGANHRLMSRLSGPARLSACSDPAPPRLRGDSPACLPLSPTPPSFEPLGRGGLCLGSSSSKCRRRRSSHRRNRSPFSPCILPYPWPSNRAQPSRLPGYGSLRRGFVATAWRRVSSARACWTAEPSTVSVVSSFSVRCSSASW